MTEYNWNEKHIITFPEEKVALSTKDLHVYYGKKESIKGFDWPVWIREINLSSQP